MYLDKTEYKTTPELSLYIENLLNPIEPEVEEEKETSVQVETKALNKIIPSEYDTNIIEEEKKYEQFKIPSWAEKTFKCLLVKSAGMDLMIPAMSVSYIEKLNKNIIRLPLDVEAFRGVVTLRERSVAVIDLFSLVSEDRSANAPFSKKVDTYHVEHVVVMENGDYALACDGIGEMVEMNAENIRWNKASFNNPVFAGIATEYLCPIVNIDNVQKQVADMPFVQSLNNHY